MKNNFWTFSDEQKSMFVAQTSERVGLPPQAVEKDWWVTMTLKALFESSCRDFITFKGGTSLSKGWHVIERFSEDIDIAIGELPGTTSRSAIGFGNFRGPISSSGSLRKCRHCWKDMGLPILSCVPFRRRTPMPIRRWCCCRIEAFMRISSMWNRKSGSNSAAGR